MNRLLFFLVMSLLSQLMFGQTNVIEYESRESMNLVGKVKTITETSFQATKINSEFVKLKKAWKYDWQNDQLYFFDTIGNLMSKKDLINSKASDNYSIKLDDKNRIIQINRLYKTTYFEYDSLSRIQSSIEINKQPESITNGNIKPTEGIYSHFLYFYDSNNLLLKKEEFNFHLKISVQTFTYDKFNNLILCELKEGSYIELHKYEYDANNSLIKYEWSDNEEGIVEITTMEYLNKMKVVEHWVDYEDGAPDGYIEDRLENGNIIETVEVASDGTMVEKEVINYQFDVKGNWIQSLIDDNGKYYIVERNIDYYD